MTPESGKRGERVLHILHTKGVPDYECKLRHLLTLLAKLHESLLSGAAIEKLRDPGDKAPMLLTEIVLNQRGYRSHFRAHRVSTVMIVVSV